MALDYIITFTLKEAGRTSVTLTGTKQSVTPSSANITLTAGSQSVTYSASMDHELTKDFTIEGLDPATTYDIRYVGDVADGSVSSVTTLTDDPKVATESQWQDLASRIKGKVDASSLSSVATSGSYNDLSDQPTLPATFTTNGWDALWN